MIITGDFNPTSTRIKSPDVPSVFKWLREKVHFFLQKGLRKGKISCQIVTVNE